MEAEDFLLKMEGIKISGGVLTAGTTVKAMVEFAKHHVELALENAGLYGEIDFEEYGGGIEGGEINYESIVNSYPLTNIK